MGHNPVYQREQPICVIDREHQVHDSIVGVQLNDSTPDQDLVAAAQFALPAFEYLYRRYVTDVYRYCLNRLRDDQDAADATSQIFVRALSNIGSCNGQSFRPWLFTIARNVVIDAWRVAGKTVELDRAEMLPDPAADPESRAIASERSTSLLATLPLLTEEQRSVIELRLAGLDGNEIAVVLGKSRNAVDQMQFRAINRIRALLNGTQSLMEEPA